MTSFSFLHPFVFFLDKSVRDNFYRKYGSTGLTLSFIFCTKSSEDYVMR